MAISPRLATSTLEITCVPYFGWSDERRPVVPEPSQNQQKDRGEPDRGDRPPPTVELTGYCAAVAFTGRSECYRGDHHQQRDGRHPHHHAVRAQRPDAVEALEYQPMHERSAEQCTDGNPHPIPP